MEKEVINSRLEAFKGAVERKEIGGFYKLATRNSAEKQNIFDGYGVTEKEFEQLWAKENPLEYFKYASPEWELWVDVKLNLPLDLIVKETKLKESDLKEIWKSLNKKDKKEFDYSAFKIFSREGQLKEFQKKQPVYYDNAGLWWLWNLNDKKWDLVDEVDILNMIQNGTGQDIINSKSRTEILNSLKQNGRLNKPKAFPKTWIQFKDKIYDVQTGESFESTPQYFAVNRIPHEINHNPETPIIDKIFEEWVGKEYIQTLYEILAYCLLPDYPIHRMFCFIGAGSNGKSCFLRMIENFVGSNNICATELDSLLNSRFELSKLHKKLVCIMGETNFSEISRTSIIKKLTGQDSIGFEFKNKNPFEDRNYAKIIIATNNLPATTDKTEGFYRRWLIIDFNNKFTEEKDILNEIPLEEYKALATKSVMILNELLKSRRFTNEGSVEERMKRYEDKSNPFDKFWNENIEEDSNSDISLKQFREKLDLWCQDNRFRKMSDVNIAHHMKSKGVERIRKTMTWIDVSYNQEKPRYWTWGGIKWKEMS